MKNLVVILIFFLPMLAYSKGFLFDISYKGIPGKNNLVELNAGYENSAGNFCETHKFSSEMNKFKLLAPGIGYNLTNNEPALFLKLILLDFFINEDYLDSENVTGVTFDIRHICLTYGGKILNINKLSKDYLDINWFELNQGIGYRFIDHRDIVLCSQFFLKFGCYTYKPDKFIHTDIYKNFQKSVNSFTAAASFNAFFYNSKIYMDFEFEYKRFLSSPNLHLLSARLRNDIWDIYSNYNMKPDGSPGSVNWKINTFLLAGYELMSIRDISSPAFNMGLGISFQLLKD